jgi:sugar phosphate isomerase/epimerase
MLSRREFSAATLSTLTASAGRKVPYLIHGVMVGAQSYSFRDRPLVPAIEAYKDCNIGICELSQGHVEPANTPREALRNWRLETPLSHFRDIRERFDNAGILLYAFNYSFNDSFSDDEIDRGFLMAKAMGVKYITASSTLKAAQRVAPFAEKHKITVAMHGHSNITDPNQFARPESFDQAMAMSKWFAVNLDIGHFYAAGYDPVDYLQRHHDKIITLHIKDRNRPSDGANLPFGEGDTPIKPVLALLKQNQWKIPANIEYEYKGADTVTEVKRCYQYIKDALA